MILYIQEQERLMYGGGIGAGNKGDFGGTGNTLFLNCLCECVQAVNLKYVYFSVCMLYFKKKIIFLSIPAWTINVMVTVMG